MHCCGEYILMELLWKIVFQFLKKLNIELPYDPAIPLLVIDPKEVKTGFQQIIYISIFVASFFTIAKR
jgi:hypothetical protein